MFDADISSMDLDCPKTWALISSGNTKGCFQLESRLGRSMAKKLKPSNIEELAALISIMRPGCISGDTLISIDRYVHTDGRIRFKKAKIRDIVNNPKKFPKLISYNEKSGKFVSNKKINAFYSGQKECFRVIVRSNERKNSDFGNREYKLECTNDHKLLTPEGWKELKDIQIGERILVSQRKGTKKPGLGNKTFRQRCYNTYQQKCIFCDWNNGSLDVNHISGNRFTNNDPENLCYMCPNHHREFTEGNIVNKYRLKHKLPKTIDGKWCKLVTKISTGIKDVYDISMKSPYNNFIAGGVIVHNCLEAIRDGKSVSNHYIDKKNGEEAVDYFHESLEPILKTTYGEMVYQEQAMEIARVVAGFNLQEADMLRKAIGKKKPEEMAKLKKTFVNGCEKTGILKPKEAEEIFNWIEKSQRYSFNKSHAVSYAMNCYLSAYAKAHFPRVFFASYLRFAKDKVDPQAEIKELVQNAIEMNIEVCKPDIRLLNEYVELKNNKIFFGLTDIKGFGKSAYEKLLSILKNSSLNIEDYSWMDLLFVLNKINSTASKALIQSGSLDHLGLTRNQMLFEYNILTQLTNKECETLQKSYNTKSTLIKNLAVVLVGKITAKRKSVVEQLSYSLLHPPYSLDDSIEWIADTENMLLGYSISCSKIDMYDISMVTCSCKDFKNGYSANNIMLAGEVENIRVVKTKKGKDVGAEMAFVSVNDGTAVVDSIVYFPETYKQYRNQLFVGNILIIKGSKSKNKDGLVAEKTYIPKP